LLYATVMMYYDTCPHQFGDTTMQRCAEPHPISSSTSTEQCYSKHFTPNHLSFYSYNATTTKANTRRGLPFKRKKAAGMSPKGKCCPARSLKSSNTCDTHALGTMCGTIGLDEDNLDHMLAWFRSPPVFSVTASDCAVHSRCSLCDRQRLTTMSKKRKASQHRAAVPSKASPADVAEP